MDEQQFIDEQNKNHASVVLGAEVNALKTELEKERSKLQKVVDFHRKEVARLKTEQQQKIDKIKKVLKKAIYE